MIIFSMGTSTEDAPRGMEFLYSLNKLNVAVSRARAVFISNKFFLRFFSSYLLKDLFAAQSNKAPFILDNYNFYTDEANYRERTYANQWLNHSYFKKFKENYSLLKEDTLWLSQSYLQYLKFAWENESLNKGRAEYRMRHSKNILIIGYSFP